MVCWQKKTREDEKLKKDLRHEKGNRGNKRKTANDIDMVNNLEWRKGEIKINKRAEPQR